MGGVYAFVGAGGWLSMWTPVRAVHDGCPGLQRHALEDNHECPKETVETRDAVQQILSECTGLSQLPRVHWLIIKLSRHLCAIGFRSLEPAVALGIKIGTAPGLTGTCVAVRCTFWIRATLLIGSRGIDIAKAAI